jgi:hypothetical protein
MAEPEPPESVVASRTRGTGGRHTVTAGIRSAPTQGHRHERRGDSDVHLHEGGHRQ